MLHRSCDQSSPVLLKNVEKRDAMRIRFVAVDRHLVYDRDTPALWHNWWHGREAVVPSSALPPVFEGSDDEDSNSVAVDEHRTADEPANTMTIFTHLMHGKNSYASGVMMTKAREGISGSRNPECVEVPGKTSYFSLQKFLLHTFDKATSRESQNPINVIGSYLYIHDVIHLLSSSRSLKMVCQRSESLRLQIREG